MAEDEDSVNDRTDFLSPSERKERMARVRAKNTKLEIAIRRLVYGLGFRYRLHARDLPGHPDIVFRGKRKVIFVHGCFWHLHANCRQYRMPKSNLEFWIPKLEETKRRDETNLERLRDMGWQSLVIWECELKNREQLSERIARFLEEIR